MDPTEKTQTKVELIYRLWSSQTTKTKDPNYVQFQPSQNLDALIVYNQKHGLRQKLSSHKVLTEGHRNKDLFDLVTDSEGVCLTNLLNGYNTSLITYGLQGRGKTHSLFGSDSIYNETRIDFNVLTKIFGEMKKQMPNLGVSLSLIEISYNETDKSENIVDLLDITCNKIDNEAYLDFSGYCNITVRTQHELEKVLRVGLKRSSNWAEKKNLDQSLIVQPKVEYHKNESHLLCKLTFLNTTQRRRFSFYLVDLIGFDNNNKESLSQISLNHINKFIDEISSRKDNVQSYRQNKLESLHSSISRGGSYNVFTGTQMKIASYLAYIMLTSQTFFFVPFYSETEPYKDSYPLFEQCFKLSTLKYQIERENFDAPKKINLILYQNFAKQTDLSINESSMMGIKTPPNEINSIRKEESGIHPFLVEGLSPINQIRSNREGIYIQDNSDIGTPIKGLGQLNKIRNEVANTMGRVDILQKKAEEYKKTSPPLEKQDTQFSSYSNRENKGTSSINKYKGSLVTDSEQKRTERYSKSTSAAFSPEKLKVQEIIKQQMTKSTTNLGLLDRDNYFSDYNKRVKEVLAIINNFMVTDINTLKKDKLPTEYYHLRRNFDILYRVFKEGENVNRALVQDFLELGNSIDEFKQEYDSRLVEAQQNQAQQQNLFNQMIEEKGIKDIFEVYERDIQNLNMESEALKEHNNKIVEEIRQVHETDPRNGVITDFNVLNKKHNHLQKQYGKIVRQLNEREEEITELRKKERLFLVEKRMVETVQNKTESLARKLESQEEKNKMLAEKLRLLEQQNQNLKDKVKGQEVDAQRLSEDYFKVMEKAALYKQMAKNPTELHMKAYKEARDSVRQDKMDRSPSSKRVQDLDKIYNKLRSFDY